MTTPTHLDPAELGTQEYWNTAYTTELKNFATNADDEGTIWFSDAGAEERMLDFLEGLADEGALCKSAGEEQEEEKEEEGSKCEAGTKNATSFLDLGTGNGHLLFALREEDWMGEMVGVDYSPQSIRLANEIRDSRGPASQYRDIRFFEWDILTQPPSASWLGAGFDVVLDKGTFDAICLSQETDADGRRVCEGYREVVEKVMKKGGRFFITSCNWTEQELRGWFEAEEGGLVFDGKVKYPSFRFGGKEGTKVATVCFRRR